jgi:hypothetical protein
VVADELETSAAALKLETDATALELEMEVTALELQTETDMSQEISKERYSVDLLHLTLKLLLIGQHQ